MKTIVFNHSLTHTHNHRRHTEDRHMPRRPPCTKLSLSTSQRITIQQSKASHAEKEHIHQLQQTGSEPSLKNEICHCLAQNVHSIKTSEMSQAPFKIVWNCWEPFVWCMSYWALTKAARLCQSNPKVPQLCSIQNVSDITSPKNHFHDDTAELAELLAFRHHFKMMTTVFLLDSGWKSEFHHVQTTACTVHFYSASATFSFVLLSITQTTKEEKITAQSWKATDRFLSAEARVEASLPCSCAANGEATHTSRKLSPCKGEHKSPPSGGPLKHDRQQG